MQLRANKHACFRRTAHDYSREERGQERIRGRNKKAKGKPRIQLPTSDSALLDELKTGKSTTELAQKYDVSPETIRNRLKEHNKKAYERIARTRTSPQSNGKRRNLPPGSKLSEEWKNGESLRDLAKKYKVSRQTITRRLREFNEQEYKRIAKEKIDAKIAEIAAQKDIPMTSSELSKQFSNGKSTRALAEQCNVSRQTISRTLARFNEEEYKNRAKHNIITGRTKELQVPIEEVFDKWENGESPENLEKLCGMSYRQILEKLRAYDPVRYKRVAERRGLGSARAKKYGARSNFELNVRRILEKHDIHTKETLLKLGKHSYRPDFPLLERKMIIEAMGLNHDWYWKRNKRKIKDYIHHKYEVIAVVPNKIYENAKKHLNRKVKILQYTEFEQFVATSLEKVPSRERFHSPTSRLLDSELQRA